VSHNMYSSSVHPLRSKRKPQSSKSLSTCTIKMVHREVSLARTNKWVSPSIALPRSMVCLKQFPIECSRGRGLCPPKRCALDRRRKIEQTAGQACPAEWQVLPPAGKKALRIAQLCIRARRLEKRLLVIARRPTLRYVLVVCPAHLQSQCWNRARAARYSLAFLVQYTNF
jgi:hypothetical protein